MFSNRENVNILTALLVAHGVRHAVVCPGSRNAPIVHNLNECAEIACHPVTDERSAAFFALGIADATGERTAVCCTSGSALLNFAPAAAEAYYRNVPIVFISADRPTQWIDQLDGQTMPQPDALGRFVRKAVTLPEPTDGEQRWHCNRLVNEALITDGPVHINVPISEPLFHFSTEHLPEQRVVKKVTDEQLLQLFLKAERPTIVVGQNDRGGSLLAPLKFLSRTVVVLGESLSDSPVPFDLVLHRVHGTALEPALRPDFVIHVGGTLVGKRLKKFLRATDAPVCRIGSFSDTFMHLQWLAEPSTISLITKELEQTPTPPSPFFQLWKEETAKAEQRIADFAPPYSQLAAVKELESQLEETDYDYQLHYANSTAVRLSNLYSHGRVWCNRGINGIEGSLSTAAGFSAASSEMVFCVIGDLSFFYDQNALWNRNLRGNLRILLLNNGCGGIFRQLKGLAASAARDELVAAAHATKAQGICVQNDCGYICAHNAQELQTGIQLLINSGTSRPMVLEVFTDPAEDARAMAALYE